MSEYNTPFDFNTFTGLYDMAAPLSTESASAMGQPGTWIAAPNPSSGVMGGGTAAQLHAPLDLAPYQGARSNVLGRCGVCFATFHHAHALDNHAKAAKHQAYKCKCGKGFTKQSALSRHVAIIDPSTVFDCARCTHRFARKDKLRDHYRNFHKVTKDTLRSLLDSRVATPRAGTPSRRRHGAPVPLAAASSGTRQTLAPAAAPAPAPAPAGPSVWPATAFTGQQQYTNLQPGPFVAGMVPTATSFAPTGSFVPAGPSVPASEPFTAAFFPGEGVYGTFENSFGDEDWLNGTNWNMF